MQTIEEQQQADAAAQVKKAGPDPEPTTEKQDTWDDTDYACFFGDYLDDGYRPGVPREVKELPPMENTLSTVSSLSDHLTWQLTACTDDPLLRDIGTAIIGNLDEDGYLVASLEEIAATGDWPEAEIERVMMSRSRLLFSGSSRASWPGWNGFSTTALFPCKSY